MGGGGKECIGVPQRVARFRNICISLLRAASKFLVRLRFFKSSLKFPAQSSEVDTDVALKVPRNKYSRCRMPFLFL